MHNAETINRPVDKVPIPTPAAINHYLIGSVCSCQFVNLQIICSILALCTPSSDIIRYRLHTQVDFIYNG